MFYLKNINYSFKNETKKEINVPFDLIVSH